MGFWEQDLNTTKCTWGIPFAALAEVSLEEIILLLGSAEVEVSLGAIMLLLGEALALLPGGRRYLRI